MFCINDKRMSANKKIKLDEEQQVEKVILKRWRGLKYKLTRMDCGKVKSLFGHE